MLFFTCSISEGYFFIFLGFFFFVVMLSSFIKGMSFWVIVLVNLYLWNKKGQSIKSKLFPCMSIAKLNKINLGALLMIVCYWKGSIGFFFLLGNGEFNILNVFKDVNDVLSTLKCKRTLAFIYLCRYIAYILIMFVHECNRLLVQW